MEYENLVIKRTLVYRELEERIKILEKENKKLKEGFVKKRKAFFDICRTNNRRGHEKK